MSNQDTIQIYTDGSGLYTGKTDKARGGYAFVALYQGRRREGYGYAEQATNNSMELAAILAGLESVRAIGIPVEIISDSAYSINAITKWMPKWKRNGWMTSTCKPVANKTLLQALERSIARHISNQGPVAWKHIRGHHGITENERADHLAGQARKQGIVDGISKTTFTLIQQSIERDSEHGI